MSIRIALLGDIVGMAGKHAVVQAIPLLRERHQANLIIVNGENIANGSGITPDLYKKLLAAGIDGVTLGDHAFRKQQIRATLQESDRLIRPANLSPKALGTGLMRLSCQPDGANAPINIYVITLIGRLFISNMPATDPFACVDRLLDEIQRTHTGDTPPIILVEMHAEATSEKVAMGWYLNGRAAAVFGTHTHIPTGDDRILPTGVPTIPAAGDPVIKGTAYITDLGMSGPYDSVLGRRVDRVLTFMSTNMPAAFDVADGNPRACGALVHIDERSGRAVKIERLDIAADTRQAPFVAS